MNWLRKLFGLHDFVVSCEIQTNDDRLLGFTFPVTVPKLFYNEADETVIKEVVKNILFVKKGIIVKEIRITDCHEK